jgi:hypothetical protein
MRGDLTSRRNKAATVPGNPSTHTMSGMGVMWQSDVTWHSSGHQHHHLLFLARVPYGIRSNRPGATCRALGRNVTVVALCYKRL